MASPLPPDEKPAPTPTADAWKAAAAGIRQLDAFKAAGLVDDEEWAEQKARILASL